MLQGTIEQALVGLKGVLVYLDDILVTAPHPVTHSRRLNIVFQCLQDWGVRFRLQRCHFEVSKVKHLGMIVSEEGIEADPSLIEVIKNL